MQGDSTSKGWHLEFRQMNNVKLPVYYSSLAPFLTEFHRGNPILTYHKLGPRPMQVRLKGLYISRSLFAQQLKELRSAGFTNGNLGTWAKPARAVIITFDDGYVNVLRHSLEPLAGAGLTAIQFLPANLLGRTNEWDVSQGEAPEPIMDVGQVRDWLAAGHEIGSHTLTHPFLTQVSINRAREEISASRQKLQDLFGRPIEHFCYPYGDWNETVRDLVQEAGYKTACTTDAGMNLEPSSPFTLKRFTARYPSRSFRSIWSWLLRAKN
jgi:peptidoglycan/xylan/chitin deacetylase (PgdA/CDA1 family)